ncbi:hypothetical protein GON03_19095 [Nocardioides sp. MAH-18]|uniref:Uncharacterized protein n=1 Tax=Nocardioides agri TaxID=2682843 RepID=A0A6L6XX82_9ACTN|nr:DUF6221 family protein [Nocardioides sp. CGMCC 1.13656]MBA2952124.1 hypothetical protein [Nocardioides sp. CGMCC 1.13656]MVQ51293.1 hypothetical protein [Nocardioides sp. MAH-18]
MNELREFLLARLAEDEILASHAAAAAPPPWEASSGWINAGGIAYDTSYSPAMGRHVAQHDPGRVRREAAAKRRIIDLCWAHTQVARSAEYPNVVTRIEALATSTLLSLAAAYADHPDYQPGWIE